MNNTIPDESGAIFKFTVLTINVNYRQKFKCLPMYQGLKPFGFFDSQSGFLKKCEILLNCITGNTSYERE